MLLPTLAYALGGWVNESDMKSMHLTWMSNHDKLYSSSEEQEARLAVFASNLDYISSHNLKYAAGETSFDMALNAHADLTFDEWKSMLTFTKTAEPHTASDAFKGEHVSRIRINGLMRGSATVDAPDAIDWRAKGAVTPVKDQGQCGSCWR